jgi:hypothetical protein
MVCSYLMMVVAVILVLTTNAINSFRGILSTGVCILPFQSAVIGGLMSLEAIRLGSKINSEERKPQKPSEVTTICKFLPSLKSSNGMLRSIMLLRRSRREMITLCLVGEGRTLSGSHVVTRSNVMSISNSFVNSETVLCHGKQSKPQLGFQTNSLLGNSLAFSSGQKGYVEKHLQLEHFPLVHQSGVDFVLTVFITN